MPWYVIYLAGIITGGVLFNSKIRRWVFKFLEIIWSTGSGGENFVGLRGRSRKRYRIVEEVGEDDDEE